MHNRVILCRPHPSEGGREEKLISLEWLCHKIEGLSKEKGDVRRVAVFKWIAAVICSEHIPVTPFTQHLEYLIEAVYRAQHDSQTTESLDDSNPTKDMADKCMHLIEAQVESTVFFRAYSAIETKWTTKRQ